MNFFDLSFWQSVVSNFAATIIGAFLGVFLALFVENRRESSTEREQKKKILKMLREELDYNRKSFRVYYMKLERGDRADLQNHSWILDTCLKTESWRSFSDSGDLKWINEPRLLAYISDAYFFVRSVGQLSDKYFQMCLVQFNADNELSGWTSGKMKDSLEEAISLANDIVRIALEQIDETNKPEKGWLDRILKR